MITSVEELRHDYNRVISHYYDPAYATVPHLGPDADFYLDLARRAQGPILELGCGTGRVLLDIHKAGIECVGLDSSESMLEVLKGKPEAEGLRLVRAQMQSFDLGSERFALVYSAFRPFQHLYTIEDQLESLRCTLRHLKPGGVFAFDVFNPKLDRVCLEEEPEVQDLRFQDGEDTVLRFVRTTRDCAKQLTRLDIRFERSRAGKLVSTEQDPIYMRWFYRYELEHLVMRAGFAEIEICGDFDRSPVEPSSPALIVVATAP